MAKRRKPTNYAKKACKLAQQWARLTETDENGNGHCFSCGAPTNYWESHGGHFQPKGRDYNAACTDKKNIHLQCIKCNMYLEGNPAGYATHMEYKYGIDIVEELFLMSKHPHNKEAMQKAIEEFKGLNKDLCKRKSFEVKVVT